MHDTREHESDGSIIIIDMFFFNEASTHPCMTSWGSELGPMVQTMRVLCVWFSIKARFNFRFKKKQPPDTPF